MGGAQAAGGGTPVASGLPTALSTFRQRAVGDLTAIALGLGAGLSPLFLGYYSDTLRSVLGLCVVVAAGVMVVANRPPARLCSGGRAGSRLGRGPKKESTDPRRPRSGAHDRGGRDAGPHAGTW